MGGSQGEGEGCNDDYRNPLRPHPPPFPLGPPPPLSGAWSLIATPCGAWSLIAASRRLVMAFLRTCTWVGVGYGRYRTVRGVGVQAGYGQVRHRFR